MGKSYNMKDLTMKSLRGRFVKAAYINKDKDLVVLDTETGRLFLTWEGDCCSLCYLAHAEGIDALVGATIIKGKSAKWVILEDDEHDVLESMGTKLTTSKGYVTFETRLSHNGYYGGEILVSDDEPMDQYHSPRYSLETDGKLPELVELKDF